uniref:ETS domain-containing protein n=1 Tax=Macrostomum lignano TaxID=282301 RepID=A0A1I8I701_9PLAT
MQQSMWKTKAECLEPTEDLHNSEFVETDLQDLHQCVGFSGDCDDQMFHESMCAENDLLPMTPVPSIAAPTDVVQQPPVKITLFPRSNTSHFSSHESQSQRSSLLRIVTQQSAETGEPTASPSWQGHPAAVAEQPRKRELEDTEQLEEQLDRAVSLPSCSSSSGASAQPPVPYKKRRKGKLLLWQFLLKDLLDGRTCIGWKELRQDVGVFAFTDANQAARRWGQYKENENMSYEKMSRCIRDYWIRNENKYYRTMIPDPMKGRRLHFAFNLQHPQVLKFIKNHPGGHYEKLVADGVIKEEIGV